MSHLIIILLTSLLQIVRMGPAYISNLQERDSVLVADQLAYGFQIDTLHAGCNFTLQDYSTVTNDTLVLVRNWQIDTLKKFKIKKEPFYAIRGTVILSPFEAGNYELPQVRIRAERPDGTREELLFDPVSLVVFEVPVDTANFVIHDIKPQMRYPVTFAEIAPWLGGGLLVAALIAFGVVMIVRSRRRRLGLEEARKEPAYIIALRRLDKFRGEKHWAPEKQKAYYSGITDALKFYMEDRFGVDAPEMTTAELFDALKSEKDISPELYNDTKALFETADFVKFAKHYASDEENAAALPTAVRFVTSTYQTELEEEQKSDVL